MSTSYFVRFGMQRYVGRFADESDSNYCRGDRVVISTLRGRELGEIVAQAQESDGVSSRLLHLARPEDLENARQAEVDRPRRLSACERLLGDGIWPFDLIDVEPLLDESRTVLYYLGPHQLDTAGLGQAFRLHCGLDAIFQPIGRDEPAEDSGSCGSCGEGGGCGSGCGESGGGCSDVQSKIW